jgi:hypothetical protein
MGLQAEMVLEHHVAEPAGELNPALCEERAGKLFVLPLKMTLERALRAETSLALPVLPGETISVSDPDWNPDSIRSVDPDPESGFSGSRRAKMTHKNRQKIRNLMF